jgi:Tfp pilus assembly protein PilV
MNHIFKNRKGLSLLEVLIAVFMITTGVLAVLGLVNFVLNSAQQSKNEFIASGLAQEGVEIVRSIRDSQDDWAAWFHSPPAGGWQVQYNTDSFNIHYNSSNFLKFDSSMGLYQYTTGVSTPFLREVKISKISDDEAKVSVDVSWKFKGNDSHIILEDRLWRWQ